MAEPFFKKQNTDDPLYLINYTQEVDTVAYLPDSGTYDKITLSDSWNTIHGKYLFMNEKIDNQTVFVTALQEYLESPGRQQVRFLWINNPNGALENWNVEILSISDGKTKGVSTYTFSNYLLSLGGNCDIIIQNTGDDYFFKISPVALGEEVFFLETDAGANHFPLLNTDILIAFTAEQIGSLQFDIRLQANSTTHPDFDTLDAGIRFYINDPDYEGYLQSLRYPLFVTPDTATHIRASLNPVQHLNPESTYFNLGVNGEAPTISTFYRTNIGQEINLMPTNMAKLVFARKPTMKIGASGSYTLVPSGAFDIDISNSVPGLSGDPVERIMCGISGIEYAGLMTNMGNQLHFFPDQPAYAPAFQSASKNSQSSTPIENKGLSDLATTAWAYISPQSGENIIYYAQPQGSVLHQGDQSGSLALYLDYLEVPAAKLCSNIGEVGLNCSDDGAGDTTLTAFPMVPYTGIPKNLIETYKLLELQALSPTRREQIKKLSKVETIDKTGDIKAATPQGLIADLNTQKTYWKGLTLGRSVNINDDTAPGHHLQFTNITGDFKAAVQSNQLFMVINNPEIFQDCASINYKLTRIALAELGDKNHGNVPNNVLKKMTANPSMIGINNTDKDDFKQALIEHGLTTLEIDTYKSVLYKYCSYAFLLINEDGYYDLADDDLDAINSGVANHSVPDSIIAQLKSSSVVNERYIKRGDFKTAISSVIGDDKWNLYGAIFIEYAYVRENGWEFNLSPSYWVNKSQSTIVIFKYAEKSLEELVTDTSTWSWKDAAKSQNESITHTQSSILKIIKDAREKEAISPDFKNFIKKVSDPYWNGILFLNVIVSLDSLPEQLQGLAAGVNPERFYGHHLGINVTPLENENGVLDIKPSSLFGLIYYDDPEDQFYDGNNPFAFKVLSLKVLFQNSSISNFYSQVELLITEFFDDQATMIDPIHGNNLLLNGVYQKHDGKDSYVFLEDEINTYEMSSAVLDRVIINHAEFVTVIPLDGLNPGDRVHTKFLLRGTIEFKALPYFDVFSFGQEKGEESSEIAKGLKFSNLTIHMDFPQEDPDKKTFGFDAGNLSFDISGSYSRDHSFYGHFPLKMNGLQQVLNNKAAGEDDSAAVTTPGDLGYISAISPLQQGKLDEGWYGFTFQLDIGTLGSLTSDVGFVVEIFIGWTPTNVDTDYNVYMGVKLPGSKSSAAEIPIEGVLKMVFKKIEFTANEIPANPALNQKEGMAYMLKFRSISLSLLGFNFPPGQIDMYIFGNPERKRSALGWYAAYVGEES